MDKISRPISDKISIKDLNEKRLGMKNFFSHECQFRRRGLEVDFIEYQGKWCKKEALASLTVLWPIAQRCR